MFNLLEKRKKLSYNALYRKFRPSTFDDVKGQDVIVKTLKNQIKSGNLSHAYLFCGTRGTGKTTVAKILAKAVNCENPQDSNPCNECSICTSINHGSSINVIEIDAASNNGVDDIRKLIEEVAYQPTIGKYKVYIIDEVHMLTGAAFNALLKTLEEPPSYVIFILATTEAHKILSTISSRCQTYNFKRISNETIVARLEELLKKEDRQVERKGLEYIAKLADGSMRDGLSLLDRCISFKTSGIVTYDEILDTLGTVDITYYQKLVQLLVKEDIKNVISVINDMISEGLECQTILSDFIWYLRNLLLVKSMDNVEDILDMSGENIITLKEQAYNISQETILRYIRILCEASDKLKYTTQKRIMLEVSFIKLLKPEMESEKDTIIERLNKLEQKQGDGVSKDLVKNIVKDYVESNSEKLALSSNFSQIEKKEKPKLSKAIPEDIVEIVKNYREYSKLLGRPIKDYMDNSKLSLSENGNLLAVFENETDYKFFESKKNEVENFFSTKAQKEIKIESTYTNSGNSFEDEFVDIENKIMMDIEVKDI